MDSHLRIKEIQSH